jgi:uncharacterized protein YqeY
MKDRDKARLGVLRLINSETKRVASMNGVILTDADVLAVLNRMLKAAQRFRVPVRAAGRVDLADQEAYEIRIIREFMPEPLAEAQLDDLIRSAIADSGAASMRDMGKVMAILRDAVQVVPISASSVPASKRCFPPSALHWPDGRPHSPILHQRSVDACRHRRVIDARRTFANQGAIIRRCAHSTTKRRRHSASIRNGSSTFVLAAARPVLH